MPNMQSTKESRSTRKCSCLEKDVRKVIDLPSMSPKAGENVTHNPILLYSPLNRRFSFSWSRHEEASQIENAFNVSVMRFSRFALFMKEKRRVERRRRDLGEKLVMACACRLSKPRFVASLMVAPCSSISAASIRWYQHKHNESTRVSYEERLEVTTDILSVALTGVGHGLSLCINLSNSHRTNQRRSC